MIDATVLSIRLLKGFFRLAVFGVLALGIVLGLFYFYEGISYLRYRDIEVTDYASLAKKIEYGQEDVTSYEMRIGAFDLVESRTCKATSEAMTRDCLERYLKAREECAEKFDEVDYSKATVSEIRELVRQFNVCRETP